MENELLKEATAEKTEKEAETTLPLKYNGEIRRLNLTEAADLAQKGIKYEALKEDYELLKNLALADGCSVPVFLKRLSEKQLENRRQELAEKCGGDSEFAEHILELERASRKKDMGLGELTEMFPEIKTEEDVPSSVLEKAKIRGTLLLDEYLRYKLDNERRFKAAEDNRKKAENSSLGSQQGFGGAVSPETEEFLKGLWRKN